MDTGLRGKIVVITGASRNSFLETDSEAWHRNIVSPILYLASDNAGFITGQCYAANGGTCFQ